MSFRRQVSVKHPPFCFLSALHRGLYTQSQSTQVWMSPARRVKRGWWADSCSAGKLAQARIWCGCLSSCVITCRSKRSA